MTTRKLLIYIFLIVLLLVCPANPSFAQTTTSGGLAGVVSDPSNAVVPGAHVDLRDLGKGTIHTTGTDENGFYQFFFQIGRASCRERVCVPV